MNFPRKLLLTLFLLLLASPTVFAASSFVVRHIRVEGLHRVSQATVFSYLPIHLGQRLHTKDSTAILRSLYKTGFFDNVRLGRHGSTLIIQVHERPTIALVSIHGNHKIKTKVLRKALSKLNIIVGDVYDSASLNAIKQGLKQEYDRLGYYAARIETRAVKESRNRVAIHINITEGPVATVRLIKITGNHAFSQHQLLKNFKLTTPGLFSFLSHKDRYSKDQLDKDLVNLKIFYLNHGYVRFRIVSRKVIISPDHKNVTIYIHVHEGSIYHLSGFVLKNRTSYEEHIFPMLTFKKGEVFSREKIMKVNTNIAKFYANKGFAFPKIRATPKINDRVHTVFLVYTIDPGKRVYVRRINIGGNHRTMDYVMRSQLRQMEASVFNLNKVNESKRKLANLPYLKNIQVTPTPVPGKPDQVDLNYRVTEVNAGKASITGGYSDTEGFIYGANISEPNFMGTGKYTALGFKRSSYSTNLSFSYNNPFFTVNGASLGYSLHYLHSRPSSTVNLDTYTMDNYGGMVTYGIPLSEYNSVSFGLGYSHIAISQIPSTAPASITTFLTRHKSPYNQVSLYASLMHSSLDRAVFPTKGTSQSLGLVVTPSIIKSTAAYYKTSYQGKWYFPLGDSGFIVSPHTMLGYGGGIGKVKQLPFFYNFYAGGIQTLPGYSPNTLGPRNPLNGNALGGNVEILGGLNFIFPNPFGPKLRTALIFNVGNIFQTNKVQNPSGTAQVLYENVALKNLRASAGIMISWYSPLGPIEVSIAKALNKKTGDDTAVFGFTFGATL